MKKDKKPEAHCIGKALGGHTARISGHTKAIQYDNPMTELVNLIIAAARALGRKETK